VGVGVDVGVKVGIGVGVLVGVKVGVGVEVDVISLQPDRASPINAKKPIRNKLFSPNNVIPPDKLVLL
jgi:hypothetical protein